MSPLSKKKSARRMIAFSGSKGTVINPGILKLSNRFNSLHEGARHIGSPVGTTTSKHDKAKSMGRSLERTPKL